MNDLLFTMRITCFPDPMIVIRAWDKGYSPPNHTRLDVEVKQGGKVIFPRGVLYCGIPGQHSIDGDNAKECVLSLVGMKPGDTDREYFDDYTPEQIEWAEKYSDLLYCEADDRFPELRGN